jgi:diguanylate cyclase (GGDEF)-like protein
MLGRYGGDEILAVLPNCNDTKTKDIATRLYHSVTEEKIPTEVEFLKINISIGCVSNQNNLHVSKMELIQASDSALLSAKKKGRDRIVLSKSL